MLKSLFALTALAALAGCQSQPTDTSSAPQAPLPVVEVPRTPTETAAPAATQCFGYAAQDTAYLSLNGPGPAVSGTLIYHYAGKDRNRGTFSGTMSGDTLRADYTFQSEGVESVREVVFVKRGAGLVEGYGPVEERGGKTVFQQPRQLKFDTKTTLAPVACK